jgi:hypothetical protein
MISGAGMAHMLYVHGFANGSSFLVISSKNYLGVESWLC